MIIINIEELRPSTTPANVFQRMSMASLATDVANNRHEFALLSQKRHSKTVFGHTQLSLITK